LFANQNIFNALVIGLKHILPYFFNKQLKIEF
jgi:hypothetical protein